MLLALRRRFWVVVISTALAALVGWMVVRDDPTVYERTASLLLRPSPDLDDGNYADALSAIQRESLSIEPTLLEIVGSDGFLAGATERAGVSDPAAYSIEPSLRPSSDVVDVRLRGPEPEGLVALAAAATSLARERLAGQFNEAYVLDPLETTAPDGPVLPDVVWSVRLAAVLGALVGIAIVFSETRLGRRARREPGPGLVS